MKRLRELRKARGFTQQEMATMLGVDRTTYTKYEGGQSEPNIDSLRQLAQIFGVTVDYLVEMSDDPDGGMELEGFAVISGGETLDLSQFSQKQKDELRTFIAFLKLKGDLDA